MKLSSVPLYFIRVFCDVKKHFSRLLELGAGGQYNLIMQDIELLSILTSFNSPVSKISFFSILNTSQGTGLVEHYSKGNMKVHTATKNSNLQFSILG